MPPLTYLVPLKTSDGEDIGDLARYLRGLSDHVAEVMVVDGSSARARRAHAVACGPRVRFVEPVLRTPMGKVGNVLTGLVAATHEDVVIADDDVRYEPAQLDAVCGYLRDAAVVRPQNYFDPRPWHATVDTARTLLARVSGGDWPGTLAVRRSAVLDAGGYAGDVMFENLELVRTLLSRGEREHVALDINVRRVPPTAAHFRGQQVRQAYDEFARPGRLLASLAVAPATAAAVRSGRWRGVAAGAASIGVAAEIGRRRGGGQAVFSASAVLLAPPWCLWRSLCAWAAVGARLRGGVRYRDHRLRRAATPLRVLRRNAPGSSLIAGSNDLLPSDEAGGRRSAAR